MFFGIAADVADIGASASDTDLEDIAVAGVTALANNITSKVYLQSLMDFTDALSDPLSETEQKRLAFQAWNVDMQQVKMLKS